MKTPRIDSQDTKLLFKGELEVLALYEEKCVPDKVVDYFYDKSRNTISIHYVISGKGIIYIDGKAHVIEKHQSFYVPPFIEVKYVADTLRPWHYIWIEIKGDFALRIANHLGFSKENPIITPYSHEAMGIFYKMLELKLSHRMHDLVYISELFLLVKALKNEEQDRNELIHKHIEDAMTYIHNNFMNNILLDDIAQNVSLNPRYFSKIFKQEIGVTPIQYLRDLRVKKAENFLIKTNLSMIEIAERTGFNDPLYFSKVFTMYHQISPKNYRKRYLK